MNHTKLKLYEASASTPDINWSDVKVGDFIIVRNSYDTQLGLKTGCKPDAVVYMTGGWDDVEDIKVISIVDTVNIEWR